MLLSKSHHENKNRRKNAGGSSELSLALTRSRWIRAGRVWQNGAQIEGVYDVEDSGKVRPEGKVKAKS